VSTCFYDKYLVYDYLFIIEMIIYHGYDYL